MKKEVLNKKVLEVLIAVLSVMVLLLSIHPAVHAEEIETGTETDIEVPESADIEVPTAMIHVKAWAGTKALIETMEGSPEPDRSEFSCVGNKEQDCFMIRIEEPGNYEYKLTLGPETFVIKIAGLYEDTEEGEEFVAKTAIIKADGTKTDEPSYTPPSDTPFGIGDIAGGPFYFIIGLIGIGTLIGVLIITRRKEKA